MWATKLRAVALAVTAASLVLAAGAAAAQPVFYGVAQVGQTVQAPIKLSATFGAAFLEGKTSKSKIECIAGTETGEVTGPERLKHVIAIFTGCNTAGLKCESAGQVEGTIQTNALEGTLGNVTSTTPGIRLYREGESGKEPKTGALEEFECGGGLTRNTITGSIVGSLSGAQGKTVEEGKFATSTKLTYAESAGAQKYTKFLAGECGGAGECGPEQLTITVNGTPELWGKSIIATIKTVPFVGKLGFTK